MLLRWWIIPNVFLLLTQATPPLNKVSHSTSHSLSTPHSNVTSSKFIQAVIAGNFARAKNVYQKEHANFALKQAIHYNHDSMVDWLAQLVDKEVLFRETLYAVKREDSDRVIQLAHHLDLEALQRLTLFECQSIAPTSNVIIRILHEFGPSILSDDQTLQIIKSTFKADASSFSQEKLVQISNILLKQRGIPSNGDAQRLVNQSTLLETKVLELTSLNQFWTELDLDEQIVLQQWTLYIHWLRTLSLDVAAGIQRSLLWTLTYREAVRQKWYETVLQQGPSVSDPRPLELAVLQLQDWKVVKVLLDYGFKPTTSKLQNSILTLRTRSWLPKCFGGV